MAPQRTAPQQSRRTISVNLKNKKGIDDSKESLGKIIPDNQAINFDKGNLYKMNEVV